ncbi:MAG: DNA mismatch repair protein MutL, partial [Oscillospiraceae bacterium]|nr:DNA mismatch repair protein MutL [Oscillospiraceae bacterium]
TVEGGRVAAAVQLQALAHPEVAFQFLRDGKQVLSTPGNGGLEAAVYCVYGRECARMAKVESRWESYSLTGFVSKPTDARPSRNLQTFFVNNRPVKSKLLVSALEEAYRNQIMVGKFPACVLHLTLPANTVDVNVHPAKTEVKFLNEKAVFDCVHYGVLGGLNKASDRPQVQFKSTPVAPVQPAPKATAPKQENFFRTMNAQEYKAFTSAIKEAPKPSPIAAAATALAVEETFLPPIREHVILPTPAPAAKPTPVVQAAPIPAEEPEQTVIANVPTDLPPRYVGELYNSYIIVEQGEEAYLIDKHAAHERILFEKLKANQETISSQALLTPVAHRTSADSAAILLENSALLEELGFEIQEFGENTLLIRQIPMDLDDGQAADALENLAADLLNGRKERKDSVRDELLHTVACKAAIKAGWQSSEAELKHLAEQVLSREDLKHCPHGRPICITLSKKQLEKQFKRS